MKKIMALTMALNDRFLRKWVDYYASRLGAENLRVFLDGEDQEVPDFCAGIQVRVLPKMQGNVVDTDRKRSRFMSDVAARLMDAEGADMVIATDADEFLVVDPDCGMELREFLSSLPDYPCYSGLGVDVMQHLPAEAPADFSRPFLSQRSRGWLHSRYTKPSVITRPKVWGGGYHRVKHTNYHIIPGLYLFHFGGVDIESLRQISADESRVANGWTRHQLKRQRAVERVSRVEALDWEPTVERMRCMQTLCRPIFALNKPTTFGLIRVVRIPERFKEII